MQSCCFAYQTYYFFEVLAAIVIVVAKAPCYFCSWGQVLVAVATREVAVVERFKEESMYGLCAGIRKVADVERWPLLEVRLYLMADNLSPLGREE